MLEGADPVDSGDIWADEAICLEGHELRADLLSARRAVRNIHTQGTM